ncbi:AAA family ATPase [Campylobacter ureolyticus]|uniref:AAA family ATPase n=1 Tax=Campylobacter ureolyticus TaxID=827 RepID=UPI00215B585A|nr:AAA family ATPase [Campylobacter ureolyticus]MCR8699674.1 AAA family ATPase [Campylobacter ureolyticus]MCZ6135546.1 AAA family ATPase [Campylobacter ureolyticus]
MELNTRNQEYNKMMKQFEAPNPNEVFKDDKVDEVSSDKNAPLSNEKGAKIDKKPVKGIISEVSNNNNNFTNKRKKEHIPVTLENLRKFALTSEQIRNHRVSWLINDFIISQSLGMIYAQAGSGKSYLAVFLALYLLKNNTINEVIYLDADNSISTVKLRNGDKWIDLTNDKLVYLSSECIGNFTQSIFTAELIKSLENGPKDCLKGKLIIFDSARNFISGDLSADYKVKPFLDDLQTLRDYGANVIFLHHQPKQPLNKDENNGLYKGATAFNDSVDYSYHLSSKRLSDDKMLILLRAIKSRNLEKNQAFILDSITLGFEFVDYDDYAMNDKQLDTIEVIQEILNENKAGISKRELIKKVLERAKLNEMEILGSNALRDFLPKLNNKFLTFEKTDEKRRNSSEIYRPL